MPRPKKRTHPPPDGSWVFEGSVSSGSDVDADDEQQPLPKASPKKTPVPRRSAEPELIMPSMNQSRVSGISQSFIQNSNGFRKRREPSRRVGQRQQEKHISETDTIKSAALWLWTEGVQPVLAYAMSVIASILGNLKPFLAAVLTIWLLMVMLRHFLNSTLSRGLKPLCHIPGISQLDLPFCNISPPSGPVEFDELMTVQSAFEDVMTSSAGGVTLPVDMKRSESSIRDLKHVVQYSALPSRNELVFEFTGFIDTAREAASQLTTFNSRIGRAVDNVISTNRWTLQVIDGVAERDAARGSIGRFLQGTLFYPFQSERVTEDLLLEQYIKHTRAIEEQIAQLIAEAQSLLAILQNLDDRLDVIHGITTRDGITIKGSRDELLAQLWTFLGGNRQSKKKHDEQLRLLKEVGTYRKTAWEHVSGTMLKLQSISAGLEDLRERVSAPDVLGPREDVPLKMHIEHIQMGVERLQEQRAEARRMEGEHHRRVLDKAERPALP